MKRGAWIDDGPGRGGRGTHGIRDWCGVWLLSLFLAVCQTGAARYEFVPAESSLVVWVPRAGLLKFVGHDHTIEAQAFHGFLEWDASEADQARLSLEVPVSTLRLLEGKDRKKIDEKMRGPAVLDESGYPSIAFISTAIAPCTESESVWNVSGILSVRGIEREVTFPAEVTFPEDGSVLASGTARMKPADFDIEPVTALAGAVRTADTIEVRFTVYGKTTEE